MTTRIEQWRKALLGNAQQTVLLLSFAELSLQYPIPRNDNKEGKESSSSTTSILSTTQQTQTQHDNSTKALDPLTAMYIQDLQEQATLQTRQLQYYRKQSAIRKQRAVSWQILQKDLHRLKDPDDDCCLAHRHHLIAQVLFVYLCHSQTEYQQGMHEVVSYLLYAIELDASIIIVGKGDFAQTLLDFCSVVLPAILPAYDTSLQQMTQRILQTVQHYQPAIYQRLQKLPLQLVFCKWIRLLFAREVCSVLPLWDALFPYHCCNTNNNNTSNSSDTTTTTRATTLLQACEALCVARLLLHRDWILETNNTTNQHTPDDLLHWLMNLAPEESLELWIPLFSRIVQNAAVDDLLPPIITEKKTATSNNTNNTTLSWTDPLSHALSQLTMTPARVPKNDNNNNNNNNNNHDNHNLLNSNAFSAFKERWVQPAELTQKIHSVSQRLFAANHHHHHEQQERDYGDPIHTPYRNADTTTMTTPHPTRNSTSQQMQQALHTVAAYLMEQPHVPANVQQAMAELQVIQQDLSRQHY